MSLFLAAVGLLIILAVVLAHGMKREAARDTLGLKASRREAAALWHPKS